MAISSEQDFINIVKKAEFEADSNIGLYKLKLSLFASLGYLVIFLLLFSLLGITGGIVASAFFSTTFFILLLKKKLIFVLLLAIWILLKALWIKFDKISGFELARDEYPNLFAEIDDLGKQLKSPKIHKVILNNELNAAIYQRPRLGIFGWNENTLILGLQLMLTLSPDEMRSVIAHELGHLSGNHSKFNGWIYRVRASWSRIMHAFDDADSWGAKILGKFFYWYSPLFDAYSFALARKNEYEADAIAAELTSPEIASKALVNVHATSPFIDSKYWDSFFEQADKFDKPQHAPFEGLAGFLSSEALSKKQMLNNIKEQMQLETHYADTHPSLKDRVDALNAIPQLPSAPEINAAQAWFDDSYSTIMQLFDNEWIDNNHEAWKNRFEYVCSSKQKLEEFDTKTPTDLDDDDLWSYAYLSNEFRSSEQSQPLFHSYLERHPKDPDASYFIGIHSALSNQEDAIEHLTNALENPYNTESAARFAFDFLEKNQRKDEAESFWQKAMEKYQVHQRNYHERNNLTEKDSFELHHLDDEKLNLLIQQLQQTGLVKKAWLAQKQVSDNSLPAVYAVSFYTTKFVLSVEKIQNQVANAIELEEILFVVCVGDDNKKLGNKIKKKGSRII